MSPARAKTFKPREVPGLARPRKPRAPSVAERVLPSGLRVVAVRRASVPLVQVRVRIPSAVRREVDLARATLMGRTMMLGTAERSQGSWPRRSNASAGPSASTRAPTACPCPARRCAPDSEICSACWPRC